MIKQFRRSHRPLIVRIFFLTSFFACCIQTSNYAQSSKQVSVTTTNPLSFGRLNQTIDISLQQLKVSKGQLQRIHVKDDAGGREILCQLVVCKWRQKP